MGISREINHPLWGYLHLWWSPQPGAAVDGIRWLKDIGQLHGQKMLGDPLVNRETGKSPCLNICHGDMYDLYTMVIKFIS